MGDAKRRKLLGIYPEQNRVSESALRHRLLASARRRERACNPGLLLEPVYIPYYETDFDIRASKTAPNCYFFEIKKDITFAKSRELYTNEQLDFELVSVRITGALLNGFLNIEHEADREDDEATHYLKGYFQAGGPLHDSLLKALTSQIS